MINNDEEKERMSIYILLVNVSFLFMQAYCCWKVGFSPMISIHLTLVGCTHPLEPLDMVFNHYYLTPPRFQRGI